jgi:hypothetical protein
VGTMHPQWLQMLRGLPCAQLHSSLLVHVLRALLLCAADACTCAAVCYCCVYRCMSSVALLRVLLLRVPQCVVMHVVMHVLHRRGMARNGAHVRLG